jgi:hypothetical protein
LITGLRQWLLALVVLAFLAGGASRLQRIVRANSAIATAERLRDALGGVRARLDACLATRDGSELRFEALARETRRLRQEVDSIEALDPRGVPEEAYDAYLTRVEEYNVALPEWERQAADLSALALECDSIAQDHNGRVASLRSFLVEEGIWEEEWLGVPDRREQGARIP